MVVRYALRRLGAGDVVIHAPGLVDAAQPERLGGDTGEGHAVSHPHCGEGEPPTGAADLKHALGPTHRTLVGGAPNPQVDLVGVAFAPGCGGLEGGGEGYLGFAHVLFHKGAHSLVLSLWKVDDTATALLMTRFYQNRLGRREDGRALPVQKL